MPTISTLQLDQNYGKFVLEPLERGYGQTIGNALRRVLFSSIQGAAVSAIKIEKVMHEFAPIPGVKEDVTQLLLNLKDLSIRLDDSLLPLEEDLTLRLEVRGPGRVTGADVECPDGVSIVNPEFYLATLSDASTLDMELFVSWGTGYVLPDKQERYKGIIGVIATGSQYTPVRKVNYTVEQTVCCRPTDYERLVLEVWSNGSVEPNDAVSQAAHILDKYFRMFFDIGRAGLEAGSFLGEDGFPPGLENIPDMRIEELEFSQRTFNCLRRAALNTLRALAMATRGALSSIRGFGKKSLQEVRDKLNEFGLELLPPKGGVRIADSLADDEDEDDY